MTMRFLISTGPIRAGVRRGFMCTSLKHRYLPAVDVDGGAVQPSGARGHDEGNEIGDVVDGAVADDAGLAAHRLAYFVFRKPGARYLGADAPPLPLRLDQARMDAIDPDAVGLAAVGEALGEGGDRGIDRGADGEIGMRLAAAGAAH